MIDSFIRPHDEMSVESVEEMDRVVKWSRDDTMREEHSDIIR